ncbi:MAG: BMP family lipoprotein, partial [Candidatus Bipolaricaulota bacterium]
MSRSKNAFHVIGYGLILVLLIGLLSCGPQKLGYAEETKIALVTDIGGRGDLSFNDMAFKGADKAAEDFGFELTVAQPSSEADYLPTLRDLARTGQYELIIGIGFLLEDAMDETAQEFSDQKFGFLDAAVDHENVKNVLFKEQENSALAGALAAMLAAHYEYSEVGAVLGIEIPVLWRFEAGYRYGIHWGLNFYESVTGERPDVGLLWNYTGTFDDVAKGKSAAEAQLAQDAGVIFNVAAPLGFGILEAINDKLSAED